MNIIQVKIDFEQGICQKQGISVVTGDYNSTKVVFEFNDSATGTKIFEMKDPNDNLVYVDEIINNEVVLVGQADVKDDNGYIKYLDESDNVYWYDSANETLYNSSYEEAIGVELDTLTKQTETTSLFGEEGDYTFEVALYENNSRITSVYDYITANKEQVIVDGEEVQERITLFDNLMNELTAAITETNNLDIDAEKVDTTTTITLTKKDGTPKEVDIEDGLDGVSLENMEINDRNLLVTYGGETNNLGQIVSNIQVGTTTTGVPSSQASVVNVGTDLNPILNFTIPKGDAGAIKMQIVVELPLIGQDDTIYLVPLETPESEENKYAEYVWVNNAWELLGKIGIQVDLTDYVRNNDYATSNKGGVIKTGFGLTTIEGTIAGEKLSYEDYQRLRDIFVISKGTLENVIAGKGIVDSTKIKTSQSTTSGEVYDVTYINSMIGDVETLLTTLDIGGGISGN